MPAPGQDFTHGGRTSQVSYLWTSLGNNPARSKSSYEYSSLIFLTYGLFSRSETRLGLYKAVQEDCQGSW